MKRLIRGFAIALLLAYALVTLSVAMSPCVYLTPNDTFLWWFWSCSKDSAGGGESGAG
jgi:hypothetical protein